MVPPNISQGSLVTRTFCIHHCAYTVLYISPLDPGAGVVGGGFRLKKILTQVFPQVLRED